MIATESGSSDGWSDLCANIFLALHVKCERHLIWAKRLSYLVGRRIKMVFFFPVQKRKINLMKINLMIANIIANG